MHKYTEEQLEFLRNAYPVMGISELTPLFNAMFNANLSKEKLRAACKRNRIKSTRTGCFESGHRPWNAGTKNQGLTGINRTSFKPGHVPFNRKLVGSERIDSKDGYTWIKVNEQNPYTGFSTCYKLKHKVIWENIYGPIPEGMIVAFIDGDKRNCSHDNLMLISRAELLRLNQYNYAAHPADIKPTILALAKVEVKIFSHLKADRSQTAGDYHI